jgi:hypothetical protein
VSEIVNLRRARKRKALEQAEIEAANRRVVFGVSRHEKQAARARRALDERALDARKLEPPETGSAGDGR